MRGQKTGGPGPTAHNLAIFASGSGSNAEKIMAHFANHPHIRVGIVVSNNGAAGVLLHAQRYGIPTLIIDKNRFLTGDAYVPHLQEAGITAVVLAGFLLKVPLTLIDVFGGKVVNIHPALLPKHGGKGMYGKHVHEAVLAQGDASSGITIHLVDGQYDHGPQLFSATCAVLPTDDAGTLAQRVLELEHRHYAPTIERWLTTP
ncbi:MAG: phosphoribosylglycinamide formyltransferase [Bacteroidetes bacterium]|nr:MAG: phosphoribosylglycinamide formyltransferase [Bacteroidota bacterium]